MDNPLRLPHPHGEVMGYYSPTMERKWGSCVWLAPDGAEVTVTAVGCEPDYPDVKSVGPVLHWVRGALRIPIPSEPRRRTWPGR